MSGVFGLVYQKPHPDKGKFVLPQMAQTLSHLPWFQAEHFLDHASGSGIGRIGISIFNNETQPCRHENGQIMCVFAGEFYNTQKARQNLEKQGIVLQKYSHAELALQLYLTQGTQFFKNVEGIFCTAIWDRAKKQLHIANDRFGMKPLYYAHDEKCFIFAPEMKGILVDPDFSKRLNLTAMAEYMRFQQVIGDKTFFEGINTLPPATLLTLNCDTFSLTEQTYWDWRSIHPQTANLTTQEISEESERLFRQAVNLRLEGAQKPGVYLSGGMDSRLILAVLDPQYHPIHTITYGHPDCRDARYAARIAHVAGTHHHFFEFNDGNWVKEVADLHLTLTEAEHSWIHAHGMSILPQTRQIIDINISGFGGGSVMGGAFQKPNLLSAPDETAFLTGMFDLYTQKHSWPGLTGAEEQLLYTPTYEKKLLGVALESLRNELAHYEHPDYSLRSMFFNLHNHDRRMNFNLIVFHNAYFENRMPFYDYQLVEWMASIPPQERANKLIHCTILDRIAPKMALIPRDRDNRLPTRRRFIYNSYHLWNRTNKLLRKWFNKHSHRSYAETLYADYENYLRHELRTWAESILYDQRTITRGIFRSETVHSLMARHMAGNEQWTIGKIVHLMSYEMMLRRYFD